MATTPATEPSAPPPQTAVSAAKPISIAELRSEIQPKAPELPAEGKLRPPVLPSVKEQKESPARPDFKAALKERVLAPKTEEAKVEVRPDAVKAPEPKDAPKKIVQFEAKADAPAKKEAVTADDAPPPVKATVPEEVPEDQRKVMPHDKPDTARRIKAILAERDAERQAAAALKTELAEAKKAGASSEELTKIREEHQKAQEELVRYRRLHDIKNDVEFNAKYDEPVKQVDAFIADTLKRNTFGESTLKAIEAEGGFAAFSRSSKTFTVQAPDPDDSTKTIPVQKTAAQLSRDWLNAINTADAEAIKASLGKQQLLQSEKAAAIEKAQAEAKGYFENQTKAQREAMEKAAQSTQQTTKEYEEWVAKTETETDFLKDRTVPETASEAEKAEVAEYNEFNKQLRASLKKHPTNAIEYGQLKLEAAEAHHLRRTLGQKDSKIAELEAALARSKGALRTTPKGGSLLKSDGATEKKSEINPNDLMGSLKDRLRKRLVDSAGDE